MCSSEQGSLPGFMFRLSGSIKWFWHHVRRLLWDGALIHFQWRTENKNQCSRLAVPLVGQFVPSQGSAVFSFSFSSVCRCSLVKFLSSQQNKRNKRVLIWSDDRVKKSIFLALCPFLEPTLLCWWMLQSVTLGRTRVPAFSSCQRNNPQLFPLIFLESAHESGARIRALEQVCHIPCQTPEPLWLTGQPCAQPSRHTCGHFFVTHPSHCGVSTLTTTTHPMYSSSR